MTFRIAMISVVRTDSIVGICSIACIVCIVGIAAIERSNHFASHLGFKRNVEKSLYV